MNRQRIQQLIDHLESIEDAEFNYSEYFTNDVLSNREIWEEFKATKTVPCGTAACLAGYAILLWKHEFKQEQNVPSCLSVEAQAREILGISHFDGRQLFVENMENATKQDGIRRLKYLLEHQTLQNYDWTLEILAQPE